MRFVEAKSVEQQALLSLHRARSLMVAVRRNLVFAGSDNGYAVLAHQSADTPVAGFKPQLFQFLRHSWPAIAPQRKAELFPDTIAATWAGATAAIGDFFSAVSGWFHKENLTDEEKAEWEQSGYDLVDNMIKGVSDGITAIKTMDQTFHQLGSLLISELWEGMKKVFADLVAWMEGKVDELLVPIVGANCLKFGTGQFAFGGPRPLCKMRRAVFNNPDRVAEYIGTGAW